MTFKCQPISLSQPCQSISFKSKVKDLYKAGILPIARDLYGSPLTRKIVTDEHIIPKRKGGSSALSNIALATKKNNNGRGNKPIERFITPKQVNEYLAQFEGLKIAGFDVGGYVKGIRQTFQKIWSKKK